MMWWPKYDSRWSIISFSIAIFKKKRNVKITDYVTGYFNRQKYWQNEIDIVILNHKVTGYLTGFVRRVNGMEEEVHEKNAKSSKVRKQANVERKDDLCEEKLAVISFLPDAGTFTDNYF